jgi:hypothetical protein
MSLPKGGEHQRFYLTSRDDFLESQAAVCSIGYSVFGSSISALSAVGPAPLWRALPAKDRHPETARPGAGSAPATFSFFFASTLT